MSLRNRLLIGVGIVLTIFVASALAIVIGQRDFMIDQLDARLELVRPLANPRGLLPPPGPAQPDTESAPPISDLFVAVVAADGSVTVISSGQLLQDEPDLSSLESGLPVEPTFLTVDGKTSTTDFRILAISGGADNPDTLVVAIPLDDITKTVSRLTYTFLAVGLLIVATLGSVGWWVIRLGLQPIAEVTETADAIAGGDRDKRAPERTESTEAGRLAKALNVMLDQRDDAEDRLREFVSDASHELRTPLTSIRGYLDVYAAGGFRAEGELDDVVRRMQAESLRMSVLVEDLLTLASLDEKRSLATSSIDVGLLVRDAAENARVTQPNRNIVVSGPKPGALTYDGDASLIQQVVAGLVDNALIYTPPETKIELSVQDLGDTVEISVSDDGPGMSSDAAAKAFDRFYRGDHSRSRQNGGSGLGLAIAQSIVKAHDGTLDVVTSPGNGCTFTVRLAR